MDTYILTWNPERWAFEEWSQARINLQARRKARHLQREVKCRPATYGRRPRAVTCSKAPPARAGDWNLRVIS